MANVKAVEDITLPDSNGDQRRVGDLWKDKPIVLVWLRHYG